MSKIIRSEELTDCEAWSVPEVSQSGAKRGVPVTARQLEEIQNQARKEGFQQGVEEGRAAGRKELAERVKRIDQLMRALDKPFEELDDAVEQQLVQLAIVIARQLVRRELKADPAQVIGVVREALAALPISARHVRLALNPEDMAIVKEALSLTDEGQNIRLLEDPVQSRGGCRVLTESSQIDATVEARLNAVIANVLGGQRAGDEAQE